MLLKPRGFPPGQICCMVKLHFRVKTDLVLGGRVVQPCSVQISEVMEFDQARPQPKSGELDGFFLALHVGADSPAFCLRRIPENGVTEVELEWFEGSVDTLKVSVGARSLNPKGARCCHIASTSITRAELLDCLKRGQKAEGFTSDQPTLKAPDNFTRNMALHRFLNVGTDLSALAKLRLRDSSLKRLDEHNQAVKNLGMVVDQHVGSCAVSPLNAGSQFVQSFTLLPMGGVLTHYGLLGYQFSCMESPVTLPVVTYNLLQAMHSTGLSFDALEAMSDADLVKRFGLAAVTRQTCCALSNNYCPDLTISSTGGVCKLRDTEDIGRTYSRFRFEVQNLNTLEAYEGHRDWKQLTLEQAMRSVAESQARLAEDPLRFGASRTTSQALADDCENSAEANEQNARSILAFCDRHPTAAALAAEMERQAAGVPHVFAEVKPAHYRRLAAVAHRLGAMQRRGDWTTSLAVASAKGPSYTEDSPQAGAGLCGHGVCVTRVWDEKSQLYQHLPVEGTTYLTVDMPPPEGYCTSVPLKLANGAVQSFPLETAMTLLGQNLHEMFGGSVHCNILAHLRSDYGDMPEKCPFYESIFYTGLSEGKGGSLGCIPLTTNPAASYRAGGKPLFGAAVMGLSKPDVVAIPITAEMLHGGKKAASAQDLKALIGGIVSEAWGPAITPRQFLSYLSQLQPVRSPDLPWLGAGNYAAYMKSENTWAYDDPAVARGAVQVYSALAERFNAIQAQDPAADGARASAFGQYLSATLTVHVPIPKMSEVTKFSLSTIRNMKRASDDLGLAETFAACLMKKQAIQCRAAVVTDHHIYMCDRGDGFVHSHRVKLAAN